MLDTMIRMQEEQIERGGEAEGEMEYDDIFVFDNVRAVGVVHY